MPLERRTGIYGDYHKWIVDSIAGDLLIELKSGHFTSHIDLHTSVEQMIRYGELASNAGVSAARIAVYLVRYGLFLA